MYDSRVSLTNVQHGGCPKALEKRLLFGKSNLYTLN